MIKNIINKLCIFFEKGLQFRKRCGIITKPSDETANRIVGVDYNEGPPVPIPNTEVKLAVAEDSNGSLIVKIGICQIFLCPFAGKIWKCNKTISFIR